jgi:integrase
MSNRRGSTLRGGSTESAQGARLLRRISTRSIFEDNVWVMDDPNPAVGRGNSVINWHRQDHKGTSLADAGNEAILDTCKEYLYLRQIGAEPLRRLKPSSLTAESTYLLQIADWMRAHGLTRFSQIGQHEIDALRSALRSRRGCWNQQAGRFVGSRPLKGHTIEAILNALRSMVMVRHALDDAPAWHPGFDDRKAGTPEYKEIPALPDALAQRVYAEALRWVTEISVVLLPAKLAIVNGIAQRERRSGRLYAKLSASSRKEWKSPLVAGCRGTVNVAGRELSLDMAPARVVSRLIHMLETACYIVVAGFTGMRISELSSLTVDCLEVHRSATGAARLCLASNLYKTASEAWQPMRWVAGYDVPDNPVRLAVELMSRIAQYEREQSGLASLFVANQFGLSQKTATSVTCSAMNVRMNQWLSFVGIETSWQLSNHQLRKTFARFTARNHRMALLALKRHFKHVSLAMTSSYAGTDSDLLQLVSDERAIEAREALEDLLGSEFLGGKMGLEIVKHNQQFRGVAGTDARGRYVDLFLQNTDVPLLSTDIGFCFAFPDTAACKLDGSRQGTTGVCGDCSNLIVMKRHVPEWKRRLVDHEQFRAQMVDADVWSEVREASWKRQREDICKVIAMLPGDPVVTT